MSKALIVINKIKVFERDGMQWTTSLNIAEVFGKEHFHVLKAIENLECSQVFRDTNFRVSNYLSLQGKEMPMFEISRDGFSFLVMGFTGKSAAEFKEAYIEAFNRMEEHLKKQVDLNDRHLLIVEKFYKELVEINQRNQALLDSLKDTAVSTDKRVETVEKAVGCVKNDVNDIKKEVANLKNAIPITRRPVSIKDKRKHILFVADIYQGLCPLCKDTQIIDSNKQPKDTLCFDHAINRHENAIDKVWAICKSCNAAKSSGMIPEIDSNGLFVGYQASMRIWLRKKQKQLKLSETECRIEQK